MVADRNAWASSGVEEVVPGVHRIPLRVPGDVLVATNVYAIPHEGGIGLIDGGWFVPDALQDLETGLASIGASIGDVTNVLATHFHPDHYTLAVELRRRTGCSVQLGIGERETIEDIVNGGDGTRAFVASLRRYGVPASLIDGNLRPRPGLGMYEHPTTWLYDGDVRAVGDVALKAIATPGHTRGHVCFADDRSGVLFAGDHVLPHITPSIGFETVSERHLPLADYLDSLRSIRERADAMLLPAHGPVGPSVHARVDELLDHHEQRLRQCAEAVGDGAVTAYDVAQRIPWTRRRRALDELAPFDRLMAVHETRAHLSVLALQGRIAVTSGQDVDEHVPA